MPVIDAQFTQELQEIEFVGLCEYEDFPAKILNALTHGGKPNVR